jgi:hypothetical protein
MVYHRYDVRRCLIVSFFSGLRVAYATCVSGLPTSAALRVRPDTTPRITDGPGLLGLPIDITQSPTCNQRPNPGTPQPETPISIH